MQVENPQFYSTEWHKRKLSGSLGKIVTIYTNSQNKYLYAHVKSIIANG